MMQEKELEPKAIPGKRHLAALNANYIDFLGVRRSRSPSRGRKINSTNRAISSGFSNASMWKRRKTDAIMDFSSINANFCPVHSIKIDTFNIVK